MKYLDLVEVSIKDVPAGSRAYSISEVSDYTVKSLKDGGYATNVWVERKAVADEKVGKWAPEELEQLKQDVDINNEKKTTQPE